MMSIFDLGLIDAIGMSHCALTHARRFFAAGILVTLWLVSSHVAVLGSFYYFATQLATLRLLVGAAVSAVEVS